MALRLPDNWERLNRGARVSYLRHLAETAFAAADRAEAEQLVHAETAASFKEQQAQAQASSLAVRAEPLANDKPPIADLVIADIWERKQHGIDTYGMPLQPFNGRDPLVDAYQEAIDLAKYLRQAIFEKYGR